MHVILKWILMCMQCAYIHYSIHIVLNNMSIVFWHSYGILFVLIYFIATSLVVFDSGWNFDRHCCPEYWQRLHCTGGTAGQRSSTCCPYNGRTRCIVFWWDQCKAYSSCEGGCCGYYGMSRFTCVVAVIQCACSKGFKETFKNSTCSFCTVSMYVVYEMLYLYIHLHVYVFGFNDVDYIYTCIKVYIHHLHVHVS